MGSNEQQRRQVACKVKIQSLVSGKYVKEEGWTPNYILTDNGVKVSRVNLLGVVVEVPMSESFQSLIVDDGSAKISVRDFEKSGLLNVTNIGDVILLIGRPREYGGEKYIIPEIVRKISDKRWIDVRKLELKMPEQEPVEDAEPVEEKNVFEKIVECIHELDKGEGVDMGEVLKIGVSEQDVSKLLREGEIFEVKPGKLKSL